MRIQGLDKQVKTLFAICIAFLAAILIAGWAAQSEFDRWEKEVQTTWSCQKLLDYIINIEETDSFVHTEVTIKEWIKDNCYN